MAIKFFEIVEKQDINKITEKDIYYVFIVDQTTNSYGMELATVSEDIALATASVYARVGKSCVCLFKKGNKLFKVEQDGTKILF
ncbi:MAG TPA: hypothetical protein PLP33_16405 [Leptospiraceae bacterium]|nr:hypothetical protein [Leptospiraceae bacterium]